MVVWCTLFVFSGVVARRTKCMRQPNIHWLKKLADIFSNKPVLVWLLTTPPDFKYVATLPCNLSLIACFLTLMFHKVVWQHMQGMVGFLVTRLLQIYQGILQWKHFVNRLTFDRTMAMSLWPHLFGPRCVYTCVNYSVIRLSTAFLHTVAI